MNSEKYPQLSSSLREFETIAQALFDASAISTGRPTDWSGVQASLAFAKIAITAQSILKLTPGTTEWRNSSNKGLWDLSSIAALSRSLIEAYLVLVYLTSATGDQNENDFRKLLWNYHCASERSKMLDHGIPDSKHRQRIREERDKSRDRLIESHFFKTLTEPEKADLLKTRTFKTIDRDRLLQIAGISRGLFLSEYRFLSAYAHAAPFAIEQLDHFQAGHSDSIQIMDTVIGVVTGFCAHALRDFIKMFPDSEPVISLTAPSIIRKWETIFKWEKHPSFSEPLNSDSD